MCSRYPAWLYVDTPGAKFCGEHEWNAEGIKEIRKEMKEQMS